MKKKRDWKTIVAYVILISFIVPIIYCSYKIAVAPSVNPENIEGIKVKTDYILMLAQCILGIIAMLLPSMISKKVNIIIPSNMYFLFLIFLFCGNFLGEVTSFFYKFKYWDVMLHTFSSLMLGAIGFSIIDLLNGQEKLHIKLTPIFVAIFSFCFAVTLGVIWEIYEFSADGALNSNMQKFALEHGIQLVGREALLDTMKDMIVDCFGAGIMAIIGYISLKYKKGWIEKLLIKKKENKEE